MGNSRTGGQGTGQRRATLPVPFAATPIDRSDSVEPLSDRVEPVGPSVEPVGSDSVEPVSDTAKPEEKAKSGNPMRLSEVPPPRRVVDLPRSTAVSATPLPVIGIEPEIDAESDTDATSDTDAKADTDAKPEPEVGVDRGPEVDAGLEVLAAAPESAPVETRDDASTRAVAGLDAASTPSTVVPKTARSAPKSAVEHVGMIGSEPQDGRVQESGSSEPRVRTLIPQLFAATVLGFLVVAGAVGTLTPAGQGADPVVQSDIGPVAPSEPAPVITPAPTQTPDLVIPSVPTDAESDLGSPDPEDRDAAVTEETSSDDSGAPAGIMSEPPAGRSNPIRPADPTGPTGGVVPQTETGTGTGSEAGPDGGTETEQGPGSEGDADDEMTPVDPAGDGDDPESENAVGTVIEIVGDVLP